MSKHRKIYKKFWNFFWKIQLAYTSNLILDQK